MLLSNQFRHKATPTVSGEMRQSDCAAATTRLAASGCVMSSWRASVFPWDGVSASGLDRRGPFAFLLQVFCTSLLPPIGLVSSETLSCPSPLGRGHLLSSLPRTPELAGAHM